MLKRIFKIVALAIVFHTQDVLSQTDDLTHTVHEKVEHFFYVQPGEKDWEAVKKAFASYKQEDLADALIADLDVDRGSPSKNRNRDIAVNKLYKALDLPPALVCKELEKDQSPRRKAALMSVLYGINTPEVTTALLRQLKDRRPAVEFIGEPEEMPVHALRVCDVACNIINSNLDSNVYARRITYTSSDIRRDEIIKQTLKELKLEMPQ